MKKFSIIFALCLMGTTQFACVTSTNNAAIVKSPKTSLYSYKDILGDLQKLKSTTFDSFLQSSRDLSVESYIETISSISSDLEQSLQTQILSKKTCEKILFNPDTFKADLGRKVGVLSQSQHNNLLKYLAIQNFNANYECQRSSFERSVYLYTELIYYVRLLSADLSKFQEKSSNLQFESLSEKTRNYIVFLNGYQHDRWSGLAQQK
ncbi:MAG: hypothetical protein EOP04_10725, partial [Proteobacteria bacterium]